MLFIILLSVFAALFTHAQSATWVDHRYLVPKGVVVLWSGNENSIPEGWVVCDGKFGTPDLRDRFVIGSGSSATNKPHSTGGSSSVTPEISVQDTVLSEAQMPRHAHDGVTDLEDNDNIYYDVDAVPEYFVYTTQRYVNNSTRFFHIRRNQWENCTTCQHTHTIKSSGENQPHSHVATSSKMNITPPFYALIYIMKL